MITRILVALAIVGLVTGCLLLAISVPLDGSRFG